MIIRETLGFVFLFRVFAFRSNHRTPRVTLSVPRSTVLGYNFSNNLFFVSVVTSNSTRSNHGRFPELHTHTHAHLLRFTVRAHPFFTGQADDQERDVFFGAAFSRTVHVHALSAT
uniref:Putative secreted peptide n=1 Tax=Anopheles braziliensis TaxID=58242 RepID=A0A2M3ZX61_9DIPT